MTQSTRFILSLFILSSFWLAGEASSAFAESGKAEILGIGANAAISGMAQLNETDNGLSIHVEIQNMSPGAHGIHVHQYGSCGNDGNDAGSHFNPDEAPHGEVIHRSVYEVHPGDLGNIHIDAEGKGSLSLSVEGLGLGSNIYNVAGRAIIIHEKSDDFGQPTGNAGGRIACGTIIITA